MTKKNRSKIKYCLNDYCKTISRDELENYIKKFKPLIDIINSSKNDADVMARAKQYDLEHQTDYLSEALNFTIYCIACHRVDCTC